MKKRKLWISILAGVMALIMVLSVIIGILPQPAEAAKSSSTLKQQLDELKQDQKEIKAHIKELQGQLSDNLSEMEQIVAQKDTIDQEIFMHYQEITNINVQISTYSVLIGDKQKELDDAQARLAELNAKNKERIRAMEEDGQLSYWSVLFKANDFADLLDRLNMVNEIAAADQRRLNEMSEAAELVASTKAELENEKAALETTKEELNETQKVLEEKRAEADRLLAELVATGDEYQKLLHDAEDQAKEVASDISSTQKDYEKVKYQEWLATSVPPTVAKPSGGGTAGSSNQVGGLTWLVPCNYTRFSSPFGYRIHPVDKVWKFHYGVDLSAPSGTPIVATRSGTVERTSYDSSSGYYVTLNHGDGFQSKYLHMTHYIVSVGQKVTAGQVIGYVGSTGKSTGPHLHFSILYNGSHVNPANYIKI